MYVTKECGGGGKRDFKKHRERFQTNTGYANSKKWDGICFWGGVGGGGVATLLKMGLRCILVCYFVKIEIVFGCRSSNNLLIHQDFKCIFSYDNLNHFIVRAPYTSYNQLRPAIPHD